MLFPYSPSLSDLQLHKKNRLKKKFIASLQNNGWQYWPHFQTIQPNASTKGKNTFQPSLSSSNIGKPQPPMSINKVNPSSPAVTPLSSDAMSVNPIPSTPAIANKRPFNTINLDSDSETGTEGDHFAPSSTLIGSKTTIFSSSAKKVFELHRSSTAHLSSPISEVSHGLKPSSIISKPPTSQSQKLLAAGLSRNIKLNMMKDLGHTLVAVKDSLLVSPEELASKLRHEATSIVMRDTYLSMKKQLHIVMLICQDISYAESLMGMLNAGLDNDSMETDALHAYYDEISKDCDV